MFEKYGFGQLSLSGLRAAYSLYVKHSPTEKAKLLRMVLSNCAIDTVSLYPTYRKPFELIFRNEASDAVRHRIASLAILSSQEALAITRQRKAPPNAEDLDFRRFYAAMGTSRRTELSEVRNCLPMARSESREALRRAISAGCTFR